jgi:L-Ala-D/L-Glu epimerase
VPLVGAGFKNAYITKTKQRSAVVRITDESGQVGLGNIDPSPGYSVETIEQSLETLASVLAPAALGQDPENIHVLTAHLDAQISQFLDAKAAIEMAATDLLGKRHKRCVSSMLGGSFLREVEFNGCHRGKTLVRRWMAFREGQDWRRHPCRQGTSRRGTQGHKPQF